MWTTFWDMHSGGDQKEKWGMIFIEAPEEEAKIIFYNRFGHNPERVTCTCCGEDYSISENDSLEQATAFHRGCRYAYFKDGKEISMSEGWQPGKGTLPGVWAGYIEESDSKPSFHEYKTLEEYLKSGNALAIYEKDILPKERIGNVPEQGYVWVD
jgi:hypothetical protein